MKRAQVSLEFLLIMGLAVTMLALFLVIGAHQLNEAASQRDLSDVLDVAHTTQLELLTAASVQNGYHRTFTLPSSIGYRPYSIVIQNSSDYSVVTFTTAKRKYSVRTPTCNGTLQPGRNDIYKENNVIACNP